MPLIPLLAVLLFAALVISFAFSLVGMLVVGALRLLPIVFVMLLVWFFVRGGRIHVDWPPRDGRRR